MGVESTWRSHTQGRLEWYAWHGNRFSADLQAPALAFLADHRVQGLVLLAAAAMLEMAVASSRAMLGDQEGSPAALARISFDRPLALPRAPTWVPPLPAQAWHAVAQAQPL